jgi:hypothetical protein
VIRHWGGERYYIPIPGCNTDEEVVEWAEGNLIDDDWALCEGPSGETLLILSDNVDDHVGAKIRFG